MIRGNSFLFKPHFQAFIAYGLGLLLIIASGFFGKKMGHEFEGAFSAMVMYILVNVMISIYQPFFMKYTLPSWGIYILLTALLLLTAKFFSGQSIRDYFEFVDMLASITAFYIIASLAIRVIKNIWDFLESENEINN